MANWLIRDVKSPVARRLYAIAGLKDGQGKHPEKLTKVSPVACQVRNAAESFA
jgi:hypothetical protein